MRVLVKSVDMNLTASAHSIIELGDMIANAETDIQLSIKEDISSMD